MKIKSNTIVNYIYNTIYQLLNIFLPLITAPYISRVLGANGIGIYAYTFSIASYYVLIEMLGVRNYGSRCIAMCQGDKKKLGVNFINIYFIQLCLSIAIFVVYLMYSICFAKYKSFAILQSYYVLSGLFDISWFFFGLEKFKMTTIRSCVVKIISVICIFVFVRDISDVNVYIAIISISMLATQMSVWPFLKQEIELCKPSWKELKKHILPNLILFIPVIAISLYKIMDKIMIGKLSTMAQSGFYENSEKIVSIPMSLITSLGTVMLPRMSNIIASGNTEKGKDVIRKSMIFVSFIGIAMVFGLMGISKCFIPWFYGNEFIPCIEITFILSPTIIFICWANVIRTQYLLPNKLDKSYIVTVFLGAAVNFVLNYILIPRYGAYGAAIGTLVAEIVVALMQTIYVIKFLPIVEYLKDGTPFALIGIFMFYIVNFIENMLNISYFGRICIEIVVGASVYCFLSALYIKFMKKELYINIVSLLKKPKKI